MDYDYDYDYDYEILGIAVYPLFYRVKRMLCNLGYFDHDSTGYPTILSSWHELGLENPTRHP